jgi:hypothetical protein
MPATYEPIATTTLGSAASDITFTSIPATFTDLRVIMVSTTSNTTGLNCQVNGDTGANYSVTAIFGDGTSASSTQLGGATRFYLTGLGAGNTSTTIPNFSELNFFSYAGSTFKTMLYTDSLDKNGSGEVFKSVNLWRSTSAITSLKLYPTAGTLNIGTTATLYGIKNA